MPHYRNGTPAQFGDLVEHQSSFNGDRSIGIVVALGEGKTCNATLLRVALIAGPAIAQVCVPMSDRIAITLGEADKLVAARPEPSKLDARKVEGWLLDNSTRLKMRDKLNEAGVEATINDDGNAITYFRNDCAIETINELLGMLTGK